MTGIPFSESRVISPAGHQPDRIPGSPKSVVQPREKVEAAVSEVDRLLRRSAEYYPRDLPPCHYVRFAGWSPPDRDVDPRDRFDLIPPLPRQLEVCRAHAEAVLVHEHLGEIIVNSREREALTIRALGILPDSEQERCREILTCPELRPGILARSTDGLLSGIEAIARDTTPATALAYGMLVLAGVRSDKEILRYAGKLDRLFDRLTSVPSFIQALDRRDSIGAANRDLLHDGANPDAEFQAKFEILTAIRNQLWALKPERLSTPFLLSQVISAYLGTQHGVGNSLGLAVVDAIMVGRVGFQFRFRLESEDGEPAHPEAALQLELLIRSGSNVGPQDRSIYWVVTKPEPLSFAPVGNTRLLEYPELFARACIGLAASHISRGRPDKAIEDYRRALELTPDSPDIYNRLAACYIRRQMPEEAAEAAGRAIELEPDSPLAHHTMGNAYALMKRWPRAIEAFKKAIALKPGYVEAYNNLGFAFHRSGSPEQAVAALEAAIEIRPDYAEGHFNLGNIQLEREQYDEAITHYREATRLRPNLAQAFYNMGQAFYRKGRLDSAIHNYRKAVEINPKHFGAWHNLGIAYRDKGLKDKAVAAIEKAISINPNLMR